MFWYSIVVDRQYALLCYSFRFHKPDKNRRIMEIVYNLFYAIGSNDFLEALMEMVIESEAKNITLKELAKDWLANSDQHPRLVCAETVDNLMIDDDEYFTGVVPLPHSIGAILKTNPLAVHGCVKLVEFGKLEFALEDGSNVLLSAFC